jgi:hypothetical protein
MFLANLRVLPQLNKYDGSHQINHCSLKGLFVLVIIHMYWMGLSRFNINNRTSPNQLCNSEDAAVFLL